MGLVTIGAPEELITVLIGEAPIRHFVELGTYKGATALWASRHFPTVVTVEASEILYRQARDRLVATKNVELQMGDSRNVLPGICAGLDAPALFWLDSHWSGGETFGAGDECPLVEELRIILATEHDHVLLIDDARLFLCAPFYPLDPEQWPSISTIINVVGQLRPSYGVCVIDDVIVAYPPRYHLVIQTYCQRRGMIMEWRLGAYLSFLHQPGLRNLLRLVRVLGGVVLKRAGLLPEVSERVMQEAPKRLGMHDR